MKHILFYFPLLFLLINHSFPVHERTKKPFIQFKATTISFDTVKAGTILKGEFSFKNTGNEMLGITRVQASDGGTIAYWPLQPVKPGAEGLIKVEFGFTETREGFQDKLFTVISNAENDLVVLHWKGYIVNRQ